VNNRKSRLKRIPPKQPPGVSCLFFRLAPKREEKKDRTTAGLSIHNGVTKERKNPMRCTITFLSVMLSLGLMNLYAQPYTLTINAAHGTVTKNPDLATYAAGDTVQLTVAPSAGYYLLNWSGDTTGAGNPITVTMYKDFTVTANFGAVITSNGTGGGLWNSAATWAGGVVPAAVDSVIVAGTDAVTVPNVVPDTCGSLVVQSNGTLTVDTGFVVRYGTMTVYGTVVDTLNGTISVASTITYGNGSLYRHARAGGSLPLATWGTGSTCAVTGITSASPGNGNQNFYNFIWNCPGQTTGLNLAWDNITIGGDLTCSASGTSAGQQFRMTSAATARNITIKGSVIVNGGFLTASGSSGAAQYNISVMGDILVESGKFGLCQGSGGFGTWKLCGDLTISGGQFVISSNTTVNTRLIFAKKNGTQYYTLTGGTNSNLHYGVDSGATVVLNSPLTVGNSNAGFLVLKEGKFVTTSTNIITMTAPAVDSLYGNNLAYVDGPMIVTVASASSTAKRFPVGKGSIFRPVVLTVTQDAATSTTYTGEMFNAAPPARTLPSTLDAVSSVHYFTITKGTGADVTNATVELSYGAGDDSVSDKTQIRVAKDDGAGNWINLGGSGSADSVGTILSNIFGSATALGTLTTNDFVVAHVNPAAVPEPATLTTNAVTDISTTFATGGGVITNDGNAAITAKGVCWNTTGSPTTSDSLTDDGTTSTPFTSTLTNLIAGTAYYVRAYAVNSAGTAYGNEVTFTTLTTLVAPTVTTDSVGNIVNTDARGYGTVTAWGGSPVTDKGICWGTSHNPTITNDYNSGGTGSGSFTAPLGGLALGTTYYVRAYAINSTGTSYGSELSFATPAPQPDVSKIVDKNGTPGVDCDYTTIQAAFNAVPTNYTGHWYIFVRKGIYYEKDTLLSGKINVVLVGEDKDSTVITYDDYAGKSSSSSGTSTSYSVAIDASDFQAQNITFQNSATTAQAVALRTNGDRQVYYNCRMLGYQDTYYTQGGQHGPDRIYNKKCYVEGSVDFIFGRDVAVFDSCVIYCNRNGGTLTAAATEAGFKFGYVFLNDSIASLAAGAIGFDGNPMSSFYLGRPWQAAPQTVFLNCYEPATLNAAGWTLMGPSPVLYSEYACTGPGAVASRPVITAWTTNQPSTLTAEQAAEYTVANIFSKSTAAAPFAYSANWTPTILQVAFPPLVNVEQEQTALPKVYSLQNNYPNPFNPSTAIRYGLPKASRVTVKIYSILGQEIATLVDGVQEAGYHQMSWNGTGKASGVYLLRIVAQSVDGSAPAFTMVKKMLLVK
jgi:pectin methylesterase-like acyl-CoA thioesterase